MLIYVVTYVYMTLQHHVVSEMLLLHTVTIRGSDLASFVEFPVI